MTRHPADSFWRGVALFLALLALSAAAACVMPPVAAKVFRR